jgi:hypothetical protein
MRMRSTPGLARRGVAAPWLVVVAPVLGLLVVWVLQIGYKRHLQHELEVAEEAAVLAVANGLVDDLLLTDNPHRQQIVEKRAIEAGRRIAALNRVGGHPLLLRENHENECQGELVLGTLQNPFSHEFNAAPEGRPDLCHPNRNAVRAALKRRCVAASATAFVDRDVIGFQIEGAMSLARNAPPAIPVIPLALLTDPAPHGTREECAERDRDSWEFRILARKGLEGDGRDFFHCHPKTGRPEEGADDIPEIRITLAAGEEGDEEGKDKDRGREREGERNRERERDQEREREGRGEGRRVNGQLTGIGTEEARQAVRQFRTGITHQDLLPRGGKLLLGEGQVHHRDGNRLLLPRLKPSAEDLQLLAQTLNDILGQPRVWLLYSPVDKQGSTRALDVVGFVAARVVRVEAGRSDDDREARHLSFILQPCELVTATAVTDCRRRDLGPRTLFNPYVCKVRLVE